MRKKLIRKELTKIVDIDFKNLKVAEIEQPYLEDYLYVHDMVDDRIKYFVEENINKDKIKYFYEQDAKDIKYIYNLYKNYFYLYCNHNIILSDYLFSFFAGIGEEEVFKMVLEVINKTKDVFSKINIDISTAEIQNKLKNNIETNFNLILMFDYNRYWESVVYDVDDDFIIENILSDIIYTNDETDEEEEIKEETEQKIYEILTTEFDNIKQEVLTRFEENTKVINNQLLQKTENVHKWDEEDHLKQVALQEFLTINNIKEEPIYLIDFVYIGNEKEDGFLIAKTEYDNIYILKEAFKNFKKHIYKTEYEEEEIKEEEK